MADPADDFDPHRILEVLDRHHVAYILVGGYAATVHGATRPTRDIDITPATTPDNLENLSAALAELDAHVRVDNVDQPLPFRSTKESLRGLRMVNLRTSAGDLDLTFEPAGFPGGYTDLHGSAQLRLVGRVLVRTAALGDVIASKQAAARPKDLAALPELHQLHAHQRDGIDDTAHRADDGWSLEL